MSAHFSKFGLNTYYGTPYFQAHVPAGYPLSLVLQKCRAFRRLPPRLRELSALAKEWAIRMYGGTPRGLLGIEEWYDIYGYELNPSTGDRLTDKEIDAEWARWDVPDVEIKDIPIPAGGFADPDTWEEPQRVAEPTDDDDGITEEQLLKDISERGREYVAKEYGLPPGEYFSDKGMARAILSRLGRK